MMFIAGMGVGAVLAIVALMIAQEWDDRKREHRKWLDEVEYSMEKAKAAHAWVDVNGYMLRRDVKTILARLKDLEKK